LKPAEIHTETPKDEGTREPSPGTSGSAKDAEKYKSKIKAMIRSPEGKLIPFRKLNKVDEKEPKQTEDNAELPKYKYIL